MKISKNKMLLLAITIATVLILTSAVNATNTTDHNTDHTLSEKISTPANSEIKETTITKENVKNTSKNKKQENKIINKENKNKTVKTASKTYDVNDFDTLHNALTSDEYDTLIVNIKSDIQLTNNTKLNETIKTLTINGNGKTIDGNNEYQFLEISSYNKVTLNNVKINNCYAYGAGGAISNYGTLTITDSNLNYNNATYFGGAIHSGTNSTLIINNSNLTHNTATYGGAIYNDRIGTINITHSNLTHNNATRWGGAISSEDGTLTITDSNLNYNNATECGGAIFQAYGNLTITQSNLNYNNATWGGAIYNNGNLTIENSKLTHNSASLGGAIDNWYGVLTLFNSTFTENHANNGGAIDSWYGNITITNCNLTNNTADNMDGRAIINEDGTLIITDSNLNYNDLTEKFIGFGGAISNEDGTLTITDSNLNYNTVTGLGGAIYTNGNTIITHNNLNYNIATENGGAIYSNGNTTITDSNLNYNTANNDGGAIDNNHSNLTIINSTLSKNIALNGNGGAINLNNIDKSIIKNSIFINNTAKSYGGALYIKGNKTSILDNTFQTNNAQRGAAIYTQTYTIEELVDKNVTLGNFNILNNILKENKANTNESAIKTIKNATMSNNTNAEQSPYKSTIYANGVNVTIMNNLFDDGIINIKITLNPVKGVIGESITLKATLTDEKGNPISGGNLAFKLNGKTLRSDGRFDSNAPAMKFSVKNGIVSYTIKADLYLRNAKNLTASYSGTSKYYEKTSDSVTAQIQKRYAQVTVTSTPTRAKQYETLTFTIKAKDTTKNGKNNTLISDNTKVMLKVNGVTLKDAKGKTLYVPIQKDATATYTYNIPADMGGITSNGSVRNYPVTAIFVGDNYYPGAKNVTTFQVERSNTTVTIQEAKVVTKTNVLSVKATLKDYKGNYLKGTNKVTIKINGKNYVDPKTGKAKYWSVKDGKVDLKDIQVDSKTTIKRVMLVTGERQAYTEGRAETTNIIRV